MRQQKWYLLHDMIHDQPSASILTVGLNLTSLVSDHPWNCLLAVSHLELLILDDYLGGRNLELGSGTYDANRL